MGIKIIDGYSSSALYIWRNSMNSWLKIEFRTKKCIKSIVPVNDYDINKFGNYQNKRKGVRFKFEVELLSKFSSQGVDIQQFLNYYYLYQDCFDHFGNYYFRFKPFVTDDLDLDWLDVDLFEIIAEEAPYVEAYKEENRPLGQILKFTGITKDLRKDNNWGIISIDNGTVAYDDAMIPLIHYDEQVDNVY